VLHLPNAAIWFAEGFTAVSVLGGVDEQEHWSERVFGGLKGGLALASNLDLSPSLGLAASFLGAGAGALAREAKTNVVVEIEAGSQGAIVALAATGLAALMLHDRETCRRALERGSAAATGHAAAEDSEADGLLERSRRALTGTLDAVPGLDRLWTRPEELKG